ncbi:chromosome partitioning protein ParA [Nephila pilipes]|uniref:Chromosome partitioning protein ParA n=1 Tax=Nephila pilipes TaxID=299642 RepID=A0A8X6QGM1_NEPPI|nr:chromosome partitioning protein ParA [Nephila pilipes]
MMRSDLVITISLLSAVDLWKIESLMNILKILKAIQSRPIPLFFVNKVPARHAGSSINEALMFFGQNNMYPDFILQSVIKERDILNHSIKFGKGVIELCPTG